MKILLLHNYYTQRGGEDGVFESERDLLLQKGHEVETLVFQNQKLQTFSEKIRTSFTSLYNPYSAKILAQKIKDFQPQILHIHNFWKEASPAVYYVAKRYNIPVVQTLHNFRLLCANALLLRQNQPCELCVKKTFPLAGIRYACYENRFITAQLTFLSTIHKVLGTWKNLVSHYITITEFAKRKFLASALHLQENQISVKPNFVEDRGEASMEDRESYFLFVGRLSVEKGVQTLMEATRLHDFALEIIGSGEMENLVREQAQNNPKIIFHGKQNQDFVLAKMKKAKALILPSICYENLPLTLIEAFSTGTPVIISDIDNLNELVTHQWNGIHFQTGSSQDLAEKIAFFEKNANPLWYENARKTYLASYTPEISYQKLMEIYQKAVDTFSHLPK
ncbi:glycosyltransferase family 4 protein [Raineya orbicola]|jgi:glycosyltransferase involved in cell wall biosynthesis|uniref:Glycosyl transferases group 1 n=1 Tax=Raineya orbicola TaxID=2016530 RepID=A0A2N3IK43_9BACT|nr:glycosyltransferase family 4 protein [Raineya orbicola]PKQ70705.1 Glycosyl transferases group 1 [Raineya orbicola]